MHYPRAVLRWFTRAGVTSIRDRPWVPIGQAPGGARVRVIGRVVQREHGIVAPLSERQCVMWSLTVEQQRVFTAPGSRQRTSGPGDWLQRLADQDVAGFDLEDGTGRAHVDVTRLIVWARRDLERRQSPLGAFGALRRVLDSYDDDGALQRASGPLRALEGVIRVGDEIAVDGAARWTDVESPPTSRGYRTPGRTRRLVIEADEDAVHASNNPDRPY